MFTSIATVSLSGSLPEKLKAISNAGFQGVEIFENDLISFNGNAADVKKIAADLGLEITVLQPFRDFEGMPESLRSLGLRRARKKFELMNRLGTDLILVCSNVSPYASGGLDRAAEDFYLLGELAREYGVRVGYEALAWGLHINDYRDAWEIVRRTNHPSVGLILDSFHTLSKGHPLAAMASIPKEKIFLVQLADAPRLDMNTLSWSRHFRNFPGQGQLAINDFMNALYQTGYQGVLSLEIFNDKFRSTPAQRTAVDGMRSLIYLEQKSREEKSTPKQQEPAAPELQGIAFIEFSIGEESISELEKFFASLGFLKSTYPGKKNIECWKQGDIYLIVNRDSDSFGRSYNNVHGSSVCSLGLLTEDPDKCLERSISYLNEPVQQDDEEIELNYPAIKTMHGGRIYFLTPEERQDMFAEKQEHPDTASAGLSTIDHIAQILSDTDLDSWRLFYRATLDLRPLDDLMISDPHGLIQSVMLQNESRSIQIALNSSQSQRTFTSKFVQQYGSSGIQQIAFSTHDIFSAVRRLKEQQVPMLEIPANYYDDIEAKFGLDHQFVQMLKQHNILYDTNPDGEFFHVYLQPFQHSFHFEIVQRRGYKEFGSANASVRIAAQKQVVGSGRYDDNEMPQQAVEITAPGVMEAGREAALQWDRQRGIFLEKDRKDQLPRLVQQLSAMAKRPITDAEIWSAAKVSAHRGTGPLDSNACSASFCRKKLSELTTLLQPLAEPLAQTNHLTLSKWSHLGTVATNTAFVPDHIGDLIDMDKDMFKVEDPSGDNAIWVLNYGDEWYLDGERQRYPLYELRIFGSEWVKRVASALS